jgi:hypothetical protein
MPPGLSIHLLDDAVRVRCDEGSLLTLEFLQVIEPAVQFGIDPRERPTSPRLDHDAGL